MLLRSACQELYIQEGTIEILNNKGDIMNVVGKAINENKIEAFEAFVKEYSSVLK